MRELLPNMSVGEERRHSAVATSEFQIFPIGFTATHSQLVPGWWRWRWHCLEYLAPPPHPLHQRIRIIIITIYSQCLFIIICKWEWKVVESRTRRPSTRNHQDQLWSLSAAETASTPPKEFQTTETTEVAQKTKGTRESDSIVGHYQNHMLRPTPPPHPPTSSRGHILCTSAFNMLIK